MLLKDTENRVALLQEIKRVTDTLVPPGERVELMNQVQGTVDDPNFPGTVLPILRGGRLIFYAAAETSSEWRDLAPLLMASVGMTTTNFTGRTDPLLLDDPVEQMLRTRGIFAVSRFQAYNPKREDIALRALARLRTLVKGVAVLPRTLPRSTAQALYDFRTALSAGDRAAAEDALEFLRQGMRVDALNRSFLEVRLDEAFGQWEHLIARASFPSLCLTRRPPAITAAMAEAFYQTAIAQVEQANNPAAALEAFRSGVLDRSGTLFTVCPPEPRPAVGKAFLLAALAAKAPDRTLIERLKRAAQSWPPEDVQFFNRLLGLVPSLPTSEQEVAIPVQEIPLTAQLDYQAQLDIARRDQLPVSPERARAVLIAAAGVQSLDAYEFALEYIARLDAAARDYFFTLPLVRPLWEEMARYGTGDCVPRDWCEWIELLPKMSVNQATTWADTAVTERPIRQQLQRHEDIARLISALSSPPPGTQEQLFNALPAFVTWIQADYRWPNKEYVTLYEQLFDLLLLSNNRSPSLYVALTVVFTGMLDVGLDRQGYCRALTDLGSMLPELSGARDIDWLVDLAELVITYPCLDGGVREQFWSKIISVLAQYGARVTTLQREVLAEIADILGLSDTLAMLPSAPVVLEPTQGPSVGHRLVGIYTLSEGVGERAARMLCKEYPGIDIRVNHDTVSTPQLRELAKRADIFVVCWLSAKHAATDAIAFERPRESVTIYAPGKGSSSIFREIRSYFEMEITEIPRARR